MLTEPYGAVSLEKKDGKAQKNGRDNQSQDHKSTGVSQQSPIRVKMQKICKHYCAQQI